jgi:hypothetical protein
MKTSLIVKMALGTAVAALVLSVGPATPASASPGINVPCAGPGGGAAGLIAAINTANGSGGGIINLAPGCTYVLSSFDNSRPGPGANGLPIVTSQITINGFNTTIARSGAPATPGFRILEIDGPGGNLTLQGLTITGGTNTFGGGIANVEGTVTLNHSRVTGNTAAMGGGGIASGVLSKQPGPIGTLTLNFSLVDNNTAGGGGGGGGGGILNHAGTLALNFSQVNGNTSGGGGGGIASGPGDAPGSGSKLTLFLSNVNNNTSTGGPNAGAGGIANGGTANIALSQVNNNTAPGASGGGILNHGTMNFVLSQVNNNTAPNDGQGNDGMGGGIANLNFGDPTTGVLNLFLSQVSNNSASGIGGGILEAGFNQDGTIGAGGPLTLTLSRVIGNTGAQGGGIYAFAGSPVTLKFTFVAANNPDNCFPHGSIPGCIG